MLLLKVGGLKPPTSESFGFFLNIFDTWAQPQVLNQTELWKFTF